MTWTVVDDRGASPPFHFAFLLGLLATGITSAALYKLFALRVYYQLPNQSWSPLGCLLFGSSIVDLIASFVYPYFAFITQWNLIHEKFMLHVYIAKFVELYVYTAQALFSALVMVAVVSSRRLVWFLHTQQFLKHRIVMIMMFVIPVLPAILGVSLTTHVTLINAYCWISSSKSDTQAQRITDCFIWPRIAIGICGLVAVGVARLRSRQKTTNSLSTTRRGNNSQNNSISRHHHQQHHLETPDFECVDSNRLTMVSLCRFVFGLCVVVVNLAMRIRMYQNVSSQHPSWSPALADSTASMTALFNSLLVLTSELMLFGPSSRERRTTRGSIYGDGALRKKAARSQGSQRTTTH